MCRANIRNLTQLREGRRQEFSFGGYNPGVWGTRLVPLLGFRGEAPLRVWDCETRSLRSWKFADIVYRFWLRSKRSKLEYFAQFASLFLTSMFYSGDGQSDSWGGLACKRTPGGTTEGLKTPWFRKVHRFYSGNYLSSFSQSTSFQVIVW